MSLDLYVIATFGRSRVVVWSADYSVKVEMKLAEVCSRNNASVFPSYGSQAIMVALRIASNSHRGR